MNTMIWIVAGALVGWLAFAAFRAGVARGLLVSIIIGAVAAFVGGAILAPMLGHPALAPNEFSPFALVTAMATAAACLLIADRVYERFGV